MSDYDNTDSGALFKNDKKGNEKAPDYTGELHDASGKKRRIAAWLRKSGSGISYMSLRVEDLRQQEPNAPQPPVEESNLADDIPF